LKKKEGKKIEKEGKKLRRKERTNSEWSSKALQKKSFVIPY